MGKGTSDCVDPGLSAMSFSMPSLDSISSRPSPSIVMSAVPAAPSASEWEMISSSWAAPWEILSPALQDSLWEVIPSVHNLVYRTPSTPKGKCDQYCELLATSLSQRGFDVKAVSGFYSFATDVDQQTAEQMAEDGHVPWDIVEDGSHTWLEIEGVLIDPTAAQFVGPDAWQGHFGDKNNWDLSHYQGFSEHFGPFPANWFIQKGWQEIDPVSYSPDWYRRY